MSETLETAAALRGPANPLLKAWQTPLRNPAICGDRARAFPPGLRAGLRRSFGRDRRHHPRSLRAGLPQHHHRAGALGQAALPGVGGVLRPGVGAFQSGAARDRQGGVVADGAALESDHDERRAVRPDRAAARQPRDARTDRRADAAAGAHLYPFPSRRRRPRRGGQEADGGDQRAAGASRHRVQPSSARRRAGMVPGTRRGRPRRPVGEFRRGGEGGRRGARHGRQGDRDAVALVGRAVPEELGPARPAREGLQGLHGARRQQQRQRQQRHHCRDPEPARGEREAVGLPDLRRLPAGGFHGEDAGGGARPAGAGLEAGPRPGARGSRRPAGAGRGGGRQFRAGAVGLALLRREAAAAPRQFRRRRDQALSVARPHDRGRVRLRHAGCSASASPSAGIFRSGIRTSGSGKSGTARAGTRRCSMATTSPGPRSAPAPG